MKIRLSVAAAATLLSFSPLAGQTPVEWSAPDRIVDSATYAITANGQTFGTQVVSLTRTDDGYRFEETSTLPQVSQTSVVLMSPDLAMRSVEQRGTARGSEMRIDVRYGAGSASGSALTPAGGATPLVIDAAVPAGIVDDNVLVALLPAIDWTAETDVIVPVFHSGKNSAVDVRLRVTGPETVATPAGSFETYRVESLGDETPLVYNVQSAAPHRVVRISIVNTPLAIVRTN